MLPAKRILSASQLLKHVKRNAEPAHLAGQCASALREVKLLSTSPSAPQPTIVWEAPLTLKLPLLSPQPLLLLILNSALKRSVPINGLLAKKIQNASLLSKIVRRNAELSNHVGLSVSPQRGAKLQSMLLNAHKQITVWAVSQRKNLMPILS